MSKDKKPKHEPRHPSEDAPLSHAEVSNQVQAHAELLEKVSPQERERMLNGDWEVHADAQRTMLDGNFEQKLKDNVGGAPAQSGPQFVPNESGPLAAAVAKVEAARTGTHAWVRVAPAGWDCLTCRTHEVDPKKLIEKTCVA